MSRPSNYNGHPILWVTPRIGQVRVDDGKLIGVQTMGVVVWNGGEGENSQVFLFSPTTEREVLITNTLFALAADLRATQDQVSRLTQAFTALVQGQNEAMTGDKN